MHGGFSADTEPLVCVNLEGKLEGIVCDSLLDLHGKTERVLLISCF